MSEAFWSGGSEALESERLFEESEVIMNLFNTSARVAGRNSRIYAKAATNLNNRYGMPRFWDTVESISVKKQVSFCLEALCCLPYFGRCLNRGNRVGGVEFLLETEAWSRRTDAGRFGFGDSASVRYGSAVLFRWFGFPDSASVRYGLVRFGTGLCKKSHRRGFLTRPYSSLPDERLVEFKFVFLQFSGRIGFSGLFVQRGWVLENRYMTISWNVL